MQAVGETGLPGDEIDVVPVDSHVYPARNVKPPAVTACEVRKASDDVADLAGEVGDVVGEVPNLDHEVRDPAREVPHLGDQVPHLEHEVPDLEREVPELEHEVPELEREAPDFVNEVPDVIDEVRDLALAGDGIRIGAKSSADGREEASGIHADVRHQHQRVAGGGGA